jgi:Gcd10p family
VNLPLEATFEVSKNGTLTPYKPAAEETIEDRIVTRDNQHLLDDDANQKLSQAEIDDLKTGLKEGKLSGKDMIAKLCENSSTFEQKNEFSQQKYLKKKAKKYVLSVKIKLASPFDYIKFSRSGTYFSAKGLREDTLAFILTLANIRSGIHVLALDTTRGILLGTILDRLNGQGTLLSLQENDQAVLTNLKRFNLADSQLAIFQTMSPPQFCHSCKYSTESDDTAHVSIEHSESLVEGFSPEKLATFSKRPFDSAILMILDPVDLQFFDTIIASMMFSRPVLFFSPYKQVKTKNIMVHFHLYFTLAIGSYF